MIVLTADRPPELRDVGAGQTIDQVKLYGDAVKWFVEVGVHDATDDRLRWIRALRVQSVLDLDRGATRARSPELPAARAADPVLAAARRRQRAARRATLGAPRPRHAATGGALTALPGRGIVVAGRHERDRSLGAAAARFAERAATRCSPTRCRARVMDRPRSPTTT